MNFMSESVEFSVEEWKRRQKNSMWKINLVSKMRVEKCQVCKEQWQEILIKLVNIHIYDEDSHRQRGSNMTRKTMKIKPLVLIEIWKSLEWLNH